MFVDNFSISENEYGQRQGAHISIKPCLELNGTAQPQASSDAVDTRTVGAIGFVQNIVHFGRQLEWPIPVSCSQVENIPAGCSIVGNAVVVDIALCQPALIGCKNAFRP